MGTGAALERLPVEILQHIFSTFGPPDNGSDAGNPPPPSPCIPDETQDLSRLCQVSHHFNDIAAPLLYRFIDLQTIPEKHLTPLLWNIAHRPHLGNYVHHLSITRLYAELEEAGRWLSKLRSWHLQTYPPSYADSLRDALSRSAEQKPGDNDFSIVLLSMFPNIQSIYVHINYDEHWLLEPFRLLSTFRKQGTTGAVEPNFPLGKLRHLNLWYQHSWLSPHRNVEPEQFLPSLKTVTISGANWAPFLDPKVNRAQNFRLTHLTMTNAVVNADIIHAILHKFPKLQHFFLWWTTPSDTDSVFLDFDSIGNGLRTRGSELERIEIFPSLNCVAPKLSIRGVIGSLKPLKGLTHLAIPLEALLGSMDWVNLTDTLPASLEALFVRSLGSRRIEFERALYGYLDSGKCAKLNWVFLEVANTLAEGFTTLEIPTAWDIEVAETSAIIRRKGNHKPWRVMRDAIGNNWMKNG